MRDELTLNLLGGSEILLAGQPLPRLKSSKARAILFYLAVTQRPHSRDHLAALLWSEMPQADAKTNLRQALAQMRRLLRDQLTITRQSVGFAADASLNVDVHIVERGVRSADATLAVRREAADRYGGDFLRGFAVSGAPAFDDWQQVIRERYHRYALQLMHQLGEHFAARRDVAAGLTYTQRLLALEPWREETYQQLMRLLAWDGQFSAALSAYAECRRVLARELGVEPLPQTNILFEQIRRARTASRASLPPDPTPFVGRRESVSAVTNQLRDPDCRLLTLHGPGGIGKTRLALAVARQQTGLFLGGIYWVSLAGIVRPELLAPTIATAIGLTMAGQTDPHAHLIAHLRDQERLLVLDNFEHLIGDQMGTAALRLLDDILTHAPQVKLLVTSRSRLHLREEQLFPLSGLSYPAANAAASWRERWQTYDALLLFVETACRQQPRFAAEKWLDAIADICRLLDGRPLGIEMAAALIGNQTPSDIAAALERNIATLETPLFNVPSRQRSLQATFDYAYRLLASDYQQLLARLAVFRGSFDALAAETIADATHAGLMTLVERSLLRLRSNGRYALHALVREFAFAHLSPAAQTAAHAQHATYYTHFLADAAGRMQGATTGAARSEIAVEIDNVRVAWQTAATQRNADALARALPALSRYYFSVGPFGEALALIRLAIASVSTLDAENALSQETAAIAASLWSEVANFQIEQGEYAHAIAAAQEAVALAKAAGATQTLAYTLTHWGWAHCRQGDYAAAMPLFEQALTHFQELDDARGVGNAYNSLGNVALVLGDLERAQPWLEQSIAAKRQAGDRRGEGVALGNLGNLLVRRGRLEAALDHARQAAAIMTEVHDFTNRAVNLLNAGRDALALGAYDEAADYLTAALTDARKVGYRLAEANILRAQGEVALRQGDLETALAKTEAAKALAEQVESWEVSAQAAIDLGRIYLSQAAWSAAVKAFQQAEQHLAELKLASLQFRAWAGLALAAARAGERATAHAAADRAADYVHTANSAAQLGTLIEPLWQLYQMFDAVGSAEATKMLQMANTGLRFVSDQIEDPTVKQQYLTAVIENRAVDQRCAFLANEDSA